MYPGSFDPVTFKPSRHPHEGLELFDTVIIAIAYNIEKQDFSHLRSAKDLIQQSINRNKNVIIDSFDGLLIDYVKDERPFRHQGPARHERL